MPAVAVASRNLTININYDEDVENPLDHVGARIASFSSRHTNYVNPESDEISVLSGPDDSRIKNKTAFILSCYEHGQCQWGLHGEVPQCRWDTAQVAGILFLEEQDYPNKHERESIARGLLELYTAYCNGAVYYYSIQVDNEDIDSCGGFFDAEYMFQAMKEYVQEGDTFDFEGDAAWLQEHYSLVDS